MTAFLLHLLWLGWVVASSTVTLIVLCAAACFGWAEWKRARPSGEAREQ